MITQTSSCSVGAVNIFGRRANTVVLAAWLIGFCTTPLPAQVVNLDAQARAGRDKLAAEVAAIDGQMLREKLQDSVANENLAHWYAGEVRVGERWIALRQAELDAANDTSWAAYAELRQQATDQLYDHERLARWCHKKQLPDQAAMHWLHVLRFDQTHRAALKALDLTWHQGMLMTLDEAKNYKARESELAKEAKAWRLKAKRLRNEAEHEDPNVNQAAKAELLAIREPEAIPALIEALAEPVADEAITEARGTQLMSILGGIDSPAAIESLVTVAVDSTNSTIRYAAIDQLKAKSYAAYVPALLAELSMPVETSVNINAVGNRMVSNYTYSQEKAGGDTYTENRQSYQYVQGRRYYSAPIYRHKLLAPERTVTGRTAWVPKHPGHGKRIVAHAMSPCGGYGTRGYTRPYDPAYLKKVNLPDQYIPARYSSTYAGTFHYEDPRYAERENEARQKLVNQAQSVNAFWEEQNQLAELRNQQIAEVLTEVTGERFSAFPKSWWNWWATYLEKHPDVGTAGTRQQLNAALLNQQQRGLARGSWVWTLQGKKAIENVLPGDYVLSQDPRTGELAYKTVLAVFTPGHMPVSKVNVEASELHCAPAHVVWASGAGWQRTSNLTAGQTLHGATAESIVDQVGEAFEIDCYDLVVDDFHTFFVGERGVLVHDGTPIQPTAAALPGFSPAAVANAVKIAAN